MLVFELQQVYGGQENISSSILNESSIRVEKNTANFSNKKTKKNGKFATICEEPENSDIHQEKADDQLEGMDKARLI